MFTAFGMSISIFLMGYAHSVTYMMILRIFMGVVTGFIGISNAFIARQTDRNEAGKVLGTLQLGGVTGMLFGPLLGGALADFFGFSSTFIITGIAIFVAALLVTFGLKEIRPDLEGVKKSDVFASGSVETYFPIAGFDDGDDYFVAYSGREF